MALEMRKICEKCESKIQADDVAFICSHECTFCKDCTDKMKCVCPNCNGELVRRPTRAE